MDTRIGRRLPWWLAGLSLVLVILGVTLSLIYIARTGDTRPLLSHQGMIPVTTLVYAILGGLVAARRPRNVIGWLFLATALMLGINALSTGHVAFDSLDPAWKLPLADWVGWAARWVWVPGIILPGLAWYFFPDGRLLSRRWRFVVWGHCLALAGAVAAIALYPGDIGGWDITGPNPLGVAGAAPVLLALLNVTGALLGVGLLTGMLALALRFRRSRGLERQQLKWVFFVAAVWFAVCAAAMWLASAFLSPAAAEEAGIALSDLFILGIAVSVSLAILRYRLYDIDLVINRTLVYAALTAAVATIYVLVVGGLGVLLQARSSLSLSLVGVGLVAFVAQPVRERLQRGVNRLMYGERDNPYAVLASLGRRLEAALAPEAVLPTLVETVATALKLPYVAITLKHAEGFMPVVEHGRPVGDRLRLPLTYQGETIGELIVSSRGPGEALSPADRQLLDDLVRQAGVAAHAVGLTLALQRSRERLVTTREEERRRLRRDLHDGLGPQLASLTLRLETARNRLAHDPDAQALLAGLAQQTEAAVADIRRLVYALRPPALDELGLVGALRETAAQYTSPSLTVTLQAPDELPPLPAAVEVAAYRITQEALANVARHAGASACVVRLAPGAAGQWLALEVHDNGRGLPANVRKGVGLGSMRERAEELGGTCHLGAEPLGGTRLSVQLPCGPAGAAERAREPEPAAAEVRGRAVPTAAAPASARAGA